MKLPGLFYISLACLCLTVPDGSAQTLRVGDPAPEFYPFRWISPAPVTVEAGRIYVLEFGATWCKPCAKAIPELAALVAAHPEVTVISTFVMELNDHRNDVNPAYVNRVKNYVEKKKAIMPYHIAVDGPDRSLEQTWIRAAGLNGIPAFFVVDKNGHIAAIVDAVSDVIPVIEQIKNPSRPVSQPAPLLTGKPFDWNKPLLIANNGGEETDFVFRSVLTRYDGLIQAPPVGYIWSRRFAPLDSIFNHLKDRVQVIGASIAHLYYLAYADTLTVNPYTRNPKWQYPDTVTSPHRKSRYGTQWHLPIVEVSDTAAFVVDRRSPINKFNYSLSVPPGTGTAAFLQQCMRADLSNYFGFRVTVEKRRMPVWGLMIADPDKVREKLLATEAGSIEIVDNSPDYEFIRGELRDIIWMLGIRYGFPPYNYGRMPVKDQTAFIDMTGLAPARINFKFNLDWTFQECTDYLASVGLAVKKTTRWMDVVVIRDP